MTLEEFKNLFNTELRPEYAQGEIDAFFLLALEEITGIVREDYMLRKSQPAKPEQGDRFKAVVRELKTHKPIQYILGSTEFFRCKLRVNEHVLIPRPETEELVSFILQEIGAEGRGSEELNILDIGTGSGCIAIALKKKLPNANISAIDVSDEALLVAKQNAILNQTRINFLQGDILQAVDLRFSDSPPPPLRTGESENRGTGVGLFNIIVSNPPYVRLSEKEKMDKNVFEHEPHLALFVNDNDPLLFYKAIADFAVLHLGPQGKLYFEINEALGTDVKKLLEAKGFKNVEIKKDMSGKDRIAKAWKM